MISVITTTYNTPANVLARTWNSLKAQTYNDWQWIVYDDSPTSNMEVFRQMLGICSDDRYKVYVYKPHVADEMGIGNAKRKAFGFAHGDILVELDHDDELAPDALEQISLAFDDPEVGFVYSDWMEIGPDGQSRKYSDGWGLGYGIHYTDEYGRYVLSMPTVNKHTLAHIVAVPNHVRAWRADVYHKVGGHNPLLRVCDDYDLILKTALVTKMQHIPKCLYYQHVSDVTAQREFNNMIQELVPVIHGCYAKEINIKYPD